MFSVCVLVKLELINFWRIGLFWSWNMRNTMRIVKLWQIYFAKESIIWFHSLDTTVFNLLSIWSRLGTWQFMTDMPYVSLSQLMMWRLLWYLHQADNEDRQNEIHPGAKCEDYMKSLTGKAINSLFKYWIVRGVVVIYLTLHRWVYRLRW